MGRRTMTEREFRFRESDSVLIVESDSGLECRFDLGLGDRKMKIKKKVSIEDLKPFLKKGYVAMDANGNWYWYREKPDVTLEYFDPFDDYYSLNCFDIKRFKGNWKNSLSECGG